MPLQSCPICGTSVEPSERYPQRLCPTCAALATSADGRPLDFGNIGMSGGFVASFLDSGEPYDSHICFVNGRACRADEARFGGIVIEPISLCDVHAGLELLNRTTAPRTAYRSESDEHYVISLCDSELRRTASRQHRFDFLCGDAGTRLPVDAYYDDLKFAIEYRERQHVEAIAFWDKRTTASGVSRGKQRALYDQRRRDTLPRHGIDLIEFDCDDFALDSNKRLARHRESDRTIVRAKLARWIDR